MHHLGSVDVGEHWEEVDREIRVLGRRRDAQDPFGRDARIVLWLSGLTRERLFADPERRRLLDTALSCGLRNCSFEFVLERCERLGFHDGFGAIDPADPSHELDARMKHVRLLKRRGSFSQALDVLGTVATALRERPPSASRDLDIAALLYSTGKALGSHQDRSGQAALLCEAAAQRIKRALRASRDGSRRTVQAPTDRIQDRAEQLWARVLDYAARQQLAMAEEVGDRSAAFARASPLWKRAIAFDERRGVTSGRSHFARQAALLASSKTEAERSVALDGFERLLLSLLAARRPDRRGVAIRAGQAAQMYLSCGRSSRAVEFQEISLRAAEDAADWPAMARTLLIAAQLTVEARESGDVRWGEAQYLLQRAADTIAKLREPPLPLLFDHCVAEARIALSIGDHNLATDRIAKAIGYVRRMRHALLTEDWSGERIGAPEWLKAIAPLLSPRERTTIQARLVRDWERLLQSQDALVDMLRSAHEIENYLGVVAMSAARENLVRSGLTHDLANVVSRRLTELEVEHGYGPEGQKHVPSQELVRVKQLIEQEIRRHVLSGSELAVNVASMPGKFFSLPRLLSVTDRQLELLRTFAPSLPPPTMSLSEDFELRCDEDLFRILFFQLLLNAAQEVAEGANPSIEIRAGWSSTGAGFIEVIDSAGQVSQLRDAVERLRDRPGQTDTGRGWGLREALRFFSTVFQSPLPEVDGEQGLRTILRLHFRPGRSVNRTVQLGLEAAQ